MAFRSWGLLGQQRWSASSSPSSTSNRAAVAGAGAEGQWAPRSGCPKRSFFGKAEEAEADEGGDEGEERGRIEQALKELRIHSAAPDWLPFYPGGSFWVHPAQIAGGRRKASPAGPLLDPISEREILALVMPMGWPNSDAVGDALKLEFDATQ